MTDSGSSSADLTVAVIDLGATSTRLLVLGAGLEVRESTITRTGEGLGRHGEITAPAMERVRSCLVEYMHVVKGASVDALRIVATSAARDASNRDNFFDMVEGCCGVRPDLLTGNEEGRLAFAGATNGLDHLGGVMMIDIGGGSTEFVTGTIDDGLIDVLSVDLGASRVTEAYLDSDPPLASELSAALSVIGLHLDDVRRELRGVADALSSGGTVIGVGGTITTVTAVEIGLLEYDRDQVHGYRLKRPDLEEVFRTLATEPANDRRHNPGLAEDRVDLIVGGACILVETFRQLDLDELLISENDLLDGVAAEMSGS